MKSYNTLLLVTFIEINDTGDLTLLSDKEEKQEDIILAWQTIVNRFNEETKGNDAGELFAIIQESRGLHKLNVLRGCYDLWDFATTWCIDTLNSIDVHVKTKTKLESRILNEENQHKLRVKRNKPAKEGGKTNWWDVIAQLQTLKPPITIDANHTTIGQFASLLNQAKKRK